MSTTSIQWTEKVWNPTRGCSRVSAGCENCYAERQALRFSGKGLPYEGLVQRDAHGKAQWTGKVVLVPEMLSAPLRWKKPQRIFVNSMSDLFHERLSDTEIAAVFGVMAACPQHTFQILTKRPKRMREWFEWIVPNARDVIYCHAQDKLTEAGEPIWASAQIKLCRSDPSSRWPLPGVWLGVSVEDQATADERIPQLRACPAAVHWVSQEPQLADVRYRPEWLDGSDGLPPLRWIVVGGESGPGARPFDLSWARSTIAQCKAAGVACFVKQLGACATDAENGIAGRSLCVPAEAAGLVSKRLRDPKGGDMEEWSMDLRIREWPNVRTSIAASSGCASTRR